MGIRARWDYPCRPKFHNQDLHSWNWIGNLILKLVCFLQLFLFERIFISNIALLVLCLCSRKNGKNSPKWAKFQNWLKTHPKVINWQSKCLSQHFGGWWRENVCREITFCWREKVISIFISRHPKSHFWALGKVHFCQKWPISGTKNGTSTAKIKILGPLFNTN